MTNAMRAQAFPVFTDDDLSITRLPGQGSRLVIAFTGIGLGMGGIQQQEFAGTASQGAANHVAFVTDRKRSWYSTQGMQDRILSVLGGMITDLGIDTVVCLGNSMGGHGALLFARRLGAGTAIAFVPQYSMDPAVVEEKRWRLYQAGIRVAGLGDLAAEMGTGLVSHVFYGADDLRDKQHSRLMIAHGAPNVYLVREADHRVAGLLKRGGVLTSAITAMINGDQPGMIAALHGHLAETHLSKGAYAHDAV